WGFGINDLDQVVGNYLDLQWNSHGFLWNTTTGEYKTIDSPPGNNPRGFDRYGTWLMAINNRGQIVGFYGEDYGFIKDYYFIYDNGTFTPIQHPNAYYAGTFIFGLNNNGQIFGEYYDGNGCSGCLFLYDDGQYFDVSLSLPDNAPYPDGTISGPA